MVIRNFFKIVDTLLGWNKQTTLPKYDSPLIFHLELMAEESDVSQV